MSIFLIQTPRSLPSDRHRMAFWINSHNAFVIKGVLDEYPIESVLKVGWLPHSFFKRKKFQFNDGEIALQALEDAEFVRNNEITIKYLEYDWGLNEQK